MNMRAFSLGLKSSQLMTSTLVTTKTAVTVDVEVTVVVMVDVSEYVAVLVAVGASATGVGGVPTVGVPADGVGSFDPASLTAVRILSGSGPQAAATNTDAANNETVIFLI
jgi:hypothetical protein